MFWTLYGVMAVVSAAGSFVAAQWIRDSNIPAPTRPGLVSLLAGILWPVVLVGGLQLLALVGIRNNMRRRTMSAGDTDAEVDKLRPFQTLTIL